MNNERERLLSDILAEPDESGDRRDALLNRTLHHVRRRQTVRRLRRAGAVLLLPVIALLVWRIHPRQGPELVNRQLPYVLVRTAPLPSSAVVATQPFASSGLVASAPSPNVASINTQPQDRGYRQIDDAALLALAGTNAVLVRLGPHSAELVFASGSTLAHISE